MLSPINVVATPAGSGATASADARLAGFSEPLRCHAPEGLAPFERFTETIQALKQTLAD